MAFKKKSKLGGLLITRKEGDTVYINRGEVIIEVVEIKKNAIRLAFKARGDVLISRGELILAGHEPVPPKPKT